MMELTTSQPVHSHRMTVKGKRGRLIRPFPLPPQPLPLPGESLMGLVARTARRNGFDELQRVLRIADIDVLRTEALPTKHIAAPGAAERLAFVMRIDPSEVTARAHPTVEMPDRESLFIDFFGIPIRAAYRDGKRRRVSPLSLRASPHHRAVWDLLPLGFCPESRETLLDRCPGCGRPLRWRRTLGIAACESCVDEEGDPTVDLREHPQPLVAVSDEPALDMILDLVRPDGDRRRAMGSLHPNIAALGPGDAFEAVIALACAATTEPNSPRGIMRRMRTIADFARITPEALARGSRVLMTWPEGFHELADDVRAAADKRAGHYGVRKELGPLLMLGRDRHLAPGLRDLIKHEVDRNMAESTSLPRVRRADNHRQDEWITALDASRRFGIARKRLQRMAGDARIDVRRAVGARSPVLFKAAQLSAMAERRSDMMAPSSAKRLLGVPAQALPALADAGLIARCGEAALLLPGADGGYSRKSVDALVQAVVRRAGTNPQPKRTSVKLSLAVKRLGGGEKPWLEILRAIVEGDLTVHAIPGCRVSLATRVGVDEIASLERFRCQADGVLSPGAGRLNHHEAAEILGVSEVMVAGLVKAGLLRRSHSSWGLARADVLSFGAAYAFTVEIASIMGVRRRDVRSLLEAQGVRPAARVTAQGGLVWDRSELQAVAGFVAPRGGSALAQGPPPGGN